MHTHFQTVNDKRKARQSAIDSLPPEFHVSVNAEDDRIAGLSIRKLHESVSANEITPARAVLAYGRKALAAQQQFNPITEVMLQQSYTQWSLDDQNNSSSSSSNSSHRPLHGVPVSLKDMYSVAGYDVSIGYSGRCFEPADHTMPLVEVVRAAGGLPYVKTNVPLSMLSFECLNDVFGKTENPHKIGYSPGGSSGGEAALIAAGGSRVGIGSDVAGSVRLPAHFCGIYALRPTVSRFPRSGGGSAIPGQEGVPSVNGPLARSLDDLTYFFRSIIEARPWEFDHHVTEIPWREAKLPPRLRFGVIRSDGIVAPTPACARALSQVVDGLKAAGHEIVEFELPSPLETLAVGSQLLCADGLDVSSGMMRWGEHFDPGVWTGWLWTRLPKFVRRIYAWYVERVKKDPLWADLLRGFERKTVAQQWALVARREQLRAQFFAQYNASGADFLLSVPNATPAFPHGGLRHSWASCLYTFAFNVLDYPAGVIPVTKVDAAQDALDDAQVPATARNAVERGALQNYDAAKMHGLPVGVQIIGKRFNEERLLAAMRVVEECAGPK